MCSIEDPVCRNWSRRGGGEIQGNSQAVSRIFSGLVEAFAGSEQIEQKMRALIKPKIERSGAGT
jgi:hypothetical protein